MITKVITSPILEEETISINLRFSESERDGSPVSFITKTNSGFRCVKESSQCRKSIVVIIPELKDNIMLGVQYKCVISKMKNGARGYVAVKLSPVMYKPEMSTIHFKKCIYQITIKWNNQCILFDPRDGRAESVRDYQKIAEYLQTRIDIEDKDSFISSFIGAAESLSLDMELENMTEVY